MISGHLFFELVEVLKMKHQCKITVLEARMLMRYQVSPHVETVVLFGCC